MKKYKILKGWHYCINFLPDIHFTDKDFIVNKWNSLTFTDDMKYVPTEASGVNKLFGHCYGLFGVHKESDRFGWNYDIEHDVFRIYAYSYNKGVLRKTKIQEVLPGETIRMLISVLFFDGMRSVSYYINGLCKHTSEYEYSKDEMFIVGLGPYFGGNDPAPKTITITKN